MLEKHRKHTLPAGAPTSAFPLPRNAWVVRLLNCNLLDSTNPCRGVEAAILLTWKSHWNWEDPWQPSKLPAAWLFRMGRLSSVLGCGHVRLESIGRMLVIPLVLAQEVDSNFHCIPVDLYAILVVLANSHPIYQQTPSSWVKHHYYSSLLL